MSSDAAIWSRLSSIDAVCLCLLLTWQTGLVRWDRLFDDLDAQLLAADAAELGGEVSDRTRREVARLHLADRARMAPGAEVSVGVGAAGAVAGRRGRSGARRGAGWERRGPSRDGSSAAVPAGGCSAQPAGSTSSCPRMP